MSAQHVHSPAVAFAPAVFTAEAVTFAEPREVGRWITVDGRHVFIPLAEQRVHGRLEAGETFAGHTHSAGGNEAPKPGTVFQHGKTGKSLTITRVGSWRSQNAADREESGGQEWHHDVYARPAKKGEESSPEDVQKVHRDRALSEGLADHEADMYANTARRGLVQSPERYFALYHAIKKVDAHLPKKRRELNAPAAEAAAYEHTGADTAEQYESYYADQTLTGAAKARVRAVYSMMQQMAQSGESGGTQKKATGRRNATASAGFSSPPVTFAEASADPADDLVIVRNNDDSSAT